MIGSRGCMNEDDEKYCLVWYFIEYDKIMLSSFVDAMFYSLQTLYWDKVILLGKLH